ncbi:MAG TPA: IucA/IucC family C-terminal-domain containing protein [Acidimicrobiales bacterium]|nr:IucA/IucC family C-terminal-domain containing protein [Acidimicrobiales bacterium]
MTRWVALDGLEAETRLVDALDRVGSALSYLRAAVGPVAVSASPGTLAGDGRWMKCEELLAHPDWLEATVRSSGGRLGTGSGAVAASLFVLGYSYRVVALAVSCMLMGGAIPSSDPEALAVAMSSGRPSLVTYREPRALALAARRTPGPATFADRALVGEALAFIVADAVDGHLRLLVDAVCSRIRVGLRLLWGNVAASSAVAFQTMEGALGEWVKPIGERFFEIAPRELQGQGNFLSLEQAGRRGWYWERRNCCLNDRLPKGVRCGDCSLTPPDQRRAAYLAGLANN